MERVALAELVDVPGEAIDPTDRDGTPLVLEEAAKQGREARFRLLVVAAYNYTCALTGYRLTTVAGTSIVDAAHIHRFADSRNNAVQNGVALSKNAHWLFDQGLWTLTDEFEVLVAVGTFVEAGPDEFRLSSYAGRRIRLPKDKQAWPDLVRVGWHRANVFEGS